MKKELLSQTVLPHIISFLEKENNQTIMDYILILHRDVNPYNFPQIAFQDHGLKNNNLRQLFIMYIEVSQEMLTKIFKKLTITQLFKELDEYLCNKVSKDQKSIPTQNKFTMFENKMIEDKRIKRFINTYKTRQQTNDIVAVIPYNDSRNSADDLNKQFFEWTHFLIQNQIYMIRDKN